MPADPTRFILVGASRAGNVGAAARAIKVMGFSDLVLVAPRHADVHRQEEAVAFASGAGDVLERARVVPTLVDALDGITWACATVMTPRDFGPPTARPRDLLPGIAATGPRAAFVFGSERYGLGNDEVWRCQASVSIPTAPGYGSLNLAQAVQLVAYEWRSALGSYPVASAPPAERLADGVAVEGLLAHWQRALVRIGFLDPAVPRKLVPRLRRLVNRAAPTHEELQILRGIATAIERSTPAPGQGPAAETPARRGSAGGASSRRDADPAGMAPAPRR